MRQRARGWPRERMLVRQKDDLRKTDAGRKMRLKERGKDEGREKENRKTVVIKL